MTAAQPTEQTPLLGPQSFPPSSSGSSTPRQEPNPWSSDPSDFADGLQTDPETPPTPSSRSDNDPKVSDGTSSRSAIIKIIAILIIGSFTSNADGSLVLATHSTIASEFGDLEGSSWLFTGFALAGAATQAISGQLSHIYGSRIMVVASYAVFALGCLIVGVGRSMWQVVFGRVISGAAAACMSVVTTLLIADYVPLRSVAAWQATLNLAATTGRSLGGPVGGWLADTIGWRWSFLGQAPIFTAAIVLSVIFLPQASPPRLEGFETLHDDDDDEEETKQNPLLRIDFFGSFLLALSILTFLTPIELSTTKIPWTTPLFWILIGLSGLLMILFLAYEANYALEPVFPPSLLRVRNVVASYVISGCQIAAQLGMMFSVPLYFQVSERASNTVAGAHLFPAVAGNAVGAILCGLWIKRTGRYKLPFLIGSISSSLSYTILILTWHGETTLLQSLYIIPSGFGTGVCLTAIFTSIQSAVDNKHRPAAVSGMYLITQVGMIVGLALASVAIIGVMRNHLERELLGLGIDEDTRHLIIKESASDINYIDSVTGDIASAIVKSYLGGLTMGHFVSLGFSLLGLLAGLVIHEVKL